MRQAEYGVMIDSDTPKRAWSWVLTAVFVIIGTLMVWVVIASPKWWSVIFSNSDVMTTIKSVGFEVGTGKPVVVTEEVKHNAQRAPQPTKK